MGVLSWPIWTCDVSEFDWEYEQKESCLLLEGEVEVKTAIETVNFSAGDFVVFPRGLKCRWKVIKPVRKHYTFNWFNSPNMNIYLWIIVAALLLEYFLYTLSRYLDLKCLSTKLPHEFKGYYSANEYSRSQEYLVENTRFSYLTSVVDLIIILMVILFGLLIM